MYLAAQDVDSDYEAPGRTVPKGGKAVTQRKATAVCKRTGRKTGEYAHITQDMLKDGGFFDMPIQVSRGIGIQVTARGAKEHLLLAYPLIVHMSEFIKLE